jgi:ribosomal-protein-alanine N-acetyltransferase
VQPLLTTARLELHAFTDEDLPLLADLHNDAEVMRYLSPDGRPWPPDILRGKLERFIKEQTAHGFSKWKVCTSSDRAMVGRAGLSVFPLTGELELGFIFRRSAWGHGYATECARALTAWLFDRRPDVGHVIAFARADNLTSKRVLEKIGMIATDSRRVDGAQCDFYRLDRPRGPAL